MTVHFPDHGLPLVQIKERRRDLVIGLRKRKWPLPTNELLEISWAQQAISAVEEVIADLDAETDTNALVEGVCLRMIAARALGSEWE